MRIEERENEYRISFPKNEFSLDELRDYTRYIRFRKLMEGSRKVSEKEIDQLAEEVNEGYVQKLSERFPFIK